MIESQQGRGFGRAQFFHMAGNHDYEKPRRYR